MSSSSREQEKQSDSHCHLDPSRSDTKTPPPSAQTQMCVCGIWNTGGEGAGECLTGAAGPASGGVEGVNKGHRGSSFHTTMCQRSSGAEEFNAYFVLTLQNVYWEQHRVGSKMNHPRCHWDSEQWCVSE